MSTQPDRSILSSPHGFFSRRGGVSEGVFAGLNCGLGSGDDRALVAENRRRVAATLSGSADTPVVSTYQVHGAHCIRVTTPWGDDRPDGDAMVTNVPGLILGILTADCGPVLFEDLDAGVIGAAHAGWKGAVGGVMEATLDAMEALGARRSSIKAALGPCIHAASYEVTLPFRDACDKADTATGAFFLPGKDTDHLQFDLPGYILARLDRLGVSAGFVDIDTYPSADHYSFRRTTHRAESDYGRQISAIMLPRP
ncbi:polyphenol oxidase family protein [Gimibacter soli]|uniref:Polyphenol oxidase family protein n=1 Tax=Gimibacter soli TaxID=3024400 RepID=A0AAE9XUD4_9PROT|nr:polyphenol oxidase family protein [Gimibacter soli]WCL55176.1 polyphenol oxidase family protein [Gimibacter soli]